MRKGTNGNKFKRTNKETHSAGMRKTFPGAGVQKDNYGGNHREVQRVQQQLSEHFPCKGRRTDWKKSFAYFSR